VHLCLKYVHTTSKCYCCGVFPLPYLSVKLTGPSLEGGQPVRQPEAHNAKGPISIYVIYIIFSI
jgi:hypothetical protein